MRKHALLVGFGLLVMLFFLGDAANVYRLGFVQFIDAKLYDYRMRMTLPKTSDDRIVILDIDEKSLKQEGRWPWGRDKMAILMDELFDHYKVAAVGFDVVFAEKDTSSGLNVLQELGRKQFKDVAQFQSVLTQIKPVLEYDSLFADKLKQRNVVLGYYFSNSENGASSSKSGALPPPVFSAGAFKGRPIEFVNWDSYGANLAELQASAATAGHFNPVVDFDGVVRRIPMIVEHEGAYYESLSLAMVRAVLGSPKLVPGFVGQSKDYGGLEWLSLESAQGDMIIPVDSRVSALIPFRGERGTFRYISLASVMRGEVPLVVLENKIVLVGTSAPGLMDMRTTPVGEVYPGVEVHANMISGILNQNIKQSPSYVLGVNVVLLTLIGISLSAILPLLSPVRGMLVTLATMTGDIVLNRYMWEYGDIALPLAGGMLMILGLFALNMSFGYFVESRSKRQITHLFGKYVPTELVDEMSKHPEQVVSMEGESREMTILFSDVRGFTTISEGLDPKELSQLMNEFLTPLSRVISKHQGKVDKYMGDCIMAFWGAPNPLPDHAHNAVLAGIEMQLELAKLQPLFKERGWPEIHIGVGINTGRVSVGNMGSEVRVAYTVMGDAVNLASRLEGITKEYGAQVLVGEGTKQAAPEFLYREVDLVRVKGKEQPVAIFEPIGLHEEVSKEVLEEIKLFNQAVRLYRKQDWDKAELQLLSLRNMYPQSKLYQVYAERVAYFRKEPPGDNWDGVFTFKTK